MEQASRVTARRLRSAVARLMAGSQEEVVSGLEAGQEDEGRELEEEAPLRTELGVDFVQMVEKLQHVVLLGLFTDRKSLQGQKNDLLGAVLGIALSVLVVSLLDEEEEKEGTTLWMTLVVWLVGSTFLWSLLILLGANDCASRKCWEWVLTSFGYALIPLAGFTFSAILLRSSGYLWIGEFVRIVGLFMVARCIGFWLLKIHHLDVRKKQPLLVYPIALIVSMAIKY